MKKIILASHGFRKNKSLKKELLRLLPSSPKNLSAAIITTASVEWKEKNKHVISARNTLKRMGFGPVKFLDVEFDDPSLLKNFDVIYISGGNTFYLLYHLMKSGVDKIFKKIAGRTVLIGVSAGAVVLGPSIKIAQYFDDERNIVKLKNFSALKLTEIIVLPHYSEACEDKVKDFEKKFRCKVTRLKDDQTVAIIGSKVEFIK